MEINTSIIIVTYNSSKDIRTCLNSLQNQSNQNFNIIIVDDQSTDDTVEIIKKEYKDVVLIEPTSKNYLTGCNNIGIRYAIKNFEPEFVMVLNPDTKVEKNLIEVLLKNIRKDSKIGAVGPKIKFMSGDNRGLINSAGLVYDGFIHAYDLGFQQKDEGQFDEVKEVFGVSGACILYRVKMLDEIGLYWTKIKLYLDEVELFIRAKKAGWKVIYTYESVVWHNYMASISQGSSSKADKLKKKSWVWIALRHYPLKSKLAMLKHYFIK